MSESGVNELIMNVREYINEGNDSDKVIRNIQNQIDQKNMQIREIFSQNLDEVIQHFIKYQEIISYHKKLEIQCEEFSKRIEKTQSLCEYDEQVIQRGEKAIELLRNKKRQYETIQDSIVKLKKIVINMGQDKYNNAIKLLASYKQNQPSCETPLKKAIPILNDKIKTHLYRLAANFWGINQHRIVEIGSLCYNKIEACTNEKMNIYQAFFGRNSSSNRNSLIRKSSLMSSIVDEGKSEAPLRFKKNITSNAMITKYTLRLNVEMNSLKQMKMMCKWLEDDLLFQQVINKQNRVMVNQIMQEHSCEYQSDLKKCLSCYIGFLLFRREINAYFNIQAENQLLLEQMYGCIGKQAKSLLSHAQNSDKVLRIKDILQLFHKVLEIVNLDSKNNQYSKVLGEIFKIYCKQSSSEYETLINQQIPQDNLTAYSTQSKSQQKDFENILYAYPDQHGNYNFTSFVVFVLQIFNEHYDRMVSFVQDSQLNKSQLHEHLSDLFEMIIIVYGGLLLTKDHPLEIAQGEINLQFCERAFKYFSEQLEVKHSYLKISELSYKPKFETIIVELRRCIRENVQAKIQSMMQSYEVQSIWLPRVPNPEYNDFIQWMMGFLKEIICFMKASGSPAHEEMAYAWIGYICHVYWNLFENCRQFNLLTIYNLQLDLFYIYKQISQHLKEYKNLPDQLKSLSQFYSLMLTNNLQDLLIKQKRVISYSSLNMHQLIPILKKYTKTPNNANGKLRDLSKKQVDGIVKKLEIQFQ